MCCAAEMLAAQRRCLARPSRAGDALIPNRSPFCHVCADSIEASGLVWAEVF